MSDVPLSSSFQRWKQPNEPTSQQCTRSLPHGFTFVPEKSVERTHESKPVTMSQRNSWIGSLWDIFALPIKAWLGPQGSLYYQPRRSIYSPSGYDLETGTAATTPGAAMFGGREQLSGRRELVEQLDSEPLFDYLLQNGALEEPLVDELRGEKSAAKVNLALLKHVESNGKPALNLFINALRQTGQHHLASLLDDTQRIKALSGSGYLSRKRHKGQISLQINVRALRFPLEELAVLKRPDTTPRKNASFRQGLGSRDWVSLDEIRYRILELTEPKIVPPLPQFEIIDPSEDDQKQKPCLCLCFSRMFSRRKGLPQQPQQQNQQGTNKAQGNNKNKKNKKGSGQQTRNNGRTNGYTPAGVDGRYRPASVYQVTNTEDERGGGQGSEEPEKGSAEEKAKEEELKHLRALEERFNGKVKDMFQAMNEQIGLMAQLAKYFEQDRGVLVLETNFDQGLVIVSICMKIEQVEQLRRDYSNGKLNKDLENCLVTETVLEKIGVKGIKLHTDINQDEFELAEQELS